MRGHVHSCDTLAECLGRDGERVEVIGVYTVAEISPGQKGKTNVPGPVRLMLGTEPGPFLEPYWSTRSVRSPEEVARYAGKMVRVRGTFLRVQPPNPDPRAASMGGPCLSDIEAISLA